jgi:anti-sigma B factor antagonist
MTKEAELKLNFEISRAGDVTVVCCTGRIAYRDEAVELSEKVGTLLPHSRQLVLELSGVEMIDSAGLGELALLLTWARAHGCTIKLAAPSDRVQHLLELTNLSSVFEIHPTLETAMLGFREQLA